MLLAMNAPIPELTDRMRQIFGLVVEAYLDRGAPVGSKMLTGSISLSPASIRGVMQELEERGLLTHPHTSAGRLPTEMGLRLFVDGIMQASLPGPAERAAIEAQIRDRPVEEALEAATATLSGLSACAGVVLTPKQEMRLRQLSFVPLSPGRALAVEGRVIEVVLVLEQACRLLRVHVKQGPARHRRGRVPVEGGQAGQRPGEFRRVVERLGAAGGRVDL